MTSLVFATSAKVTGVTMEQGMYICKGFYENKIMLVGKQVTPQQLNELLLKKVNSLRVTGLIDSLGETHISLKTL